jgi:hypothetical protein
LEDKREREVLLTMLYEDAEDLLLDSDAAEAAGGGGVNVLDLGIDAAETKPAWRGALL